MISLKALELFWIEEAIDDPEDQCAHGYVELSINGTTFIDKNSGEFTLSAASLFLLRTLFDEHTEQRPVTEGEFLFPCCGFNIYRSLNRKDAVYILGCPTGVNLNITHRDTFVEISNEKSSERTTLVQYAEQVIAFSESIYKFYEDSSPKESLEDKEDGNNWELFWTEWNSLLLKGKRLLESH